MRMTRRKLLAMNRQLTAQLNAQSAEAVEKLRLKVTEQGAVIQQQKQEIAAYRAKLDQLEGGAHGQEEIGQQAQAPAA